IELGAVKRLFGGHAYELSMSSTKSAIGHLLGAAGSVEAILAILAIRDGVVPPTLNLDNPSPSCDIDLVPKRAKERRCRMMPCSVNSEAISERPVCGGITVVRGSVSGPGAATSR
ncbi:MAG: hypothetical protein JOZ11_06875, partial [Alphaproteobacteria bacterium]|nr:hypothetical protein [Alphaproteobacteria bacterium]